MRLVSAGCFAWALVALLVGCGDGPVVSDSSKSARASGGGQFAAARAGVLAVWPTPDDGFFRGAPLETFVQPAASGRVESGLYGSTRNGGRRFHEGLDLRPLARDGQGEAIDEIKAALAGVVRHVSARPGASSYGRYVVLEHPLEQPAVYTLYAHLAAVKTGLAPGGEVQAGQPLGVMGRSAGGYTIPKDRAHLHFEIGLRVSDRFDAWYAEQGFGNPNEHGRWNGMNLLGLDPLAFFERLRAGSLPSIKDWMQTLPVAVVVSVDRAVEPDFIRRYPSLLEVGAGDADFSAGRPYGWEIGFDSAGVPLRWRRVVPPMASLPAKKLLGQVIEVNEAAVAGQPGKELVKKSPGGGYVTGETIQTTLFQLFQ